MFALARQTAPLIQEDVRAMAGLEVEGEDQAGFIDPELFGDIPDVFTAFTLRRGAGGAARRRDVLVEGLRGRDGPGDGPHDPRDGRARAPHLPRHRAAGVQPQDDGALGGRGDHPDRRRAHRRVHRPRPRRARARAHLPVPGARHRAAARPPDREDLPQFHRLGGRAHQRRLRHGPRARRVTGARRLLRRDPRRPAPSARPTT